jgi:hypothetical protein
MHFFVVAEPVAGNTGLANFVFDVGNYATNSINLAISAGGIRSTEGRTFTDVSVTGTDVKYYRAKTLNYGGLNQLYKMVKL